MRGKSKWGEIVQLYPLFRNKSSPTSSPSFGSEEKLGTLALIEGAGRNTKGEGKEGRGIKP